jgi:hypothetical protein
LTRRGGLLVNDIQNILPHSGNKRIFRTDIHHDRMIFSMKKEKIWSGLNLSFFLWEFLVYFFGTELNLEQIFVTWIQN